MVVISTEDSDVWWVISTEYINVGASNEESNVWWVPSMASTEDSNTWRVLEMKIAMCGGCHLWHLLKIVIRWGASNEDQYVVVISTQDINVWWVLSTDYSDV